MYLNQLGECARRPRSEGSWKSQKTSYLSSRTIIYTHSLRQEVFDWSKLTLWSLCCIQQSEDKLLPTYRKHLDGQCSAKGNLNQSGFSSVFKLIVSMNIYHLPFFFLWFPHSFEPACWGPKGLLEKQIIICNIEQWNPENQHLTLRGRASLPGQTVDVTRALSQLKKQKTMASE
jgi:hypothetical protein